MADTWRKLYTKIQEWQWYKSPNTCHLFIHCILKARKEASRSQLQNKETALSMLASKLLLMRQAEHEKKLSDIKGENMDINFGSQIRSYVFHPYKLVKDHRTNTEIGNVDSVMDGDIDKFIDEYLKKS